MQNRYAGDVGDFGKLGMLRTKERAGIKVGINWYLVEDENHNEDGKHIGYLQDKKFDGIDDELHNALDLLVRSNNRTVKQFEDIKLLNTETYYHEVLKPSKENIREDRLRWHKNGLKNMEKCELVFLDPDNGLLPKSVGYGSIKSIKYVLPEEVMDYYEAGHSIVFYSHRTREKLDVYLHRFDALFNSNKLEKATVVGVTFRRGTVRDYFFIIQQKHLERILKGLNDLLCSKWKLHFELISCLDYKGGQL